MSLRLAAVVAAVVIAIDQAVKALVRADVPQGSSRELLPGIELVHTKNTGVSFGFLSGAPAWVVGLFSTVALVAVVIVFIRTLPGPLGRFAAGLIVGGAVGNLIDRIAFGSVTDFLDLPALPPCNVADIAITFGAIAFAVGLLFAETAERKAEKHQDADDRAEAGA
ncbi:MAG: signal peptidase II [Solirubrobacteraceae bacterium]|nr:signal peptidase II [Solirubrobacteraceae bacterium]